MNAQELPEKVKVGMDTWVASAPGRYIIAGEWGFDWDTMQGRFRFNHCCRCALSTLLPEASVAKVTAQSELAAAVAVLELSAAQVSAFIRGFDRGGYGGDSYTSAFYDAGQKARAYALQRGLFEGSGDDDSEVG